MQHSPKIKSFLSARFLFCLFLTLILVAYFFLFRSVIFSNNNYISWQNYVGPISTFQAKMWFGRLLTFFFNPFQYNGSVLILTSIFSKGPDIIYTGTLCILSIFFGARLASVIIILLIPILLYLTSFLMLNELTKSKLAALFGAFFLVTNSFMLLTMVYGNVLPDFLLAILFLGIYFLQKGLQRRGLLDIFILFSIVLLLSTISFIQAFVLGVLFYFIIVFYNLVFYGRQEKGRWIISMAKFGVGSLLLVVSILGYYAGNSYVLPNSVYAPPLSNFEQYSADFFQVFFLRGYPVNLVNWLSSSSFDSFVPFWLWSDIQVAFVSLILIVGIFYRDRRVIFFFLIIMIASVLGTGTSGLFSTVNTFFYTHIPGYQSLNASYYWDWIIIMPGFSIIFSFVISHVISGEGEITSPSKNMKRFNDGDYRFNKSPFVRSGRVKTMAVFLLMIAVLVIPISSSGYSNQYTGIRTIELPNDYTAIPYQLSTLIKNNYTGVLFLNPDNYIYLNNSWKKEGGFISPFVNQLNLRTPGLPFYGAPPFEENDYFYWLLKEFYENKTANLAQLLALSGISYIVDLKNTNSAEQGGRFIPWSNYADTAKLLNGQNHIAEIYSSANYTIYKDYYTDSVVSTVNSDIILLSDSYDSLNYLVSTGLNVLNYSIIYLNDITPNNWNTFMNLSSGVFIPNNSSLTGLALQLLSKGNQNVVSLANPYSNDPSSSFVNTERLKYYYGQNYLINYSLSSFVSPVLVTTGSAYLNWSYGSQIPTNSEIYVNLLHSSNSGQIMIELNGNSIAEINTTLNTTGGALRFEWNDFNMSTNLSVNTLSIHSVKGLNSIASVYIVNESQLSDEIQSIKSQLSLHGFITSHQWSYPEMLLMNETGFRGLASGFKLTPDGYQVDVNNSNLLVFRIPFFSSVRVSNGYVYSALSSLNTFVVLPVGSSAVTTYYASPKMIAYSIEIPIIFTVAYLAACFVINYKRRR